MNNYYCLLTIPVLNTEHWMEIGVRYKIPFHPNLTDEIELMGFFAKIDSIYYTLEDFEDGLAFVVITLTAIDGLSVNLNDNESAIALLKEKYRELQEWHPDLILNDSSCYSELIKD